jgi:hypothetical protein
MKRKGERIRMSLARHGRPGHPGQLAIKFDYDAILNDRLKALAKLERLARPSGYDWDPLSGQS